MRIGDKDYKPLEAALGADQETPEGKILRDCELPSLSFVPGADLLALSR